MGQSLRDIIAAVVAEVIVALIIRRMKQGRPGRSRDPYRGEKPVTQGRTARIAPCRIPCLWTKPAVKKTRPP
jgi:hypothetical protein